MFCGTMFRRSGHHQQPTNIYIHIIYISVLFFFRAEGLMAVNPVALCLYTYIYVCVCCERANAERMNDDNDFSNGKTGHHKNAFVRSDILKCQLPYRMLFSDHCSNNLVQHDMMCTNLQNTWNNTRWHIKKYKCLLSRVRYGGPGFRISSPGIYSPLRVNNLRFVLIEGHTFCVLRTLLEYQIVN